jgi:hypothetical protein
MWAIYNKKENWHLCNCETWCDAYRTIKIWEKSDKMNRCFEKGIYQIRKIKKV